MKLREVTELIVDSEHKTAPKEETGYPYIRTPNIGEGRLILDNVQRISEESYEEWTRRAVPKKKDLILAREAPVGNVAIVTDGIKPCLGQRTVLIRPDSEKVSPVYLVYLLLGNEIQDRFYALSTGSTVAHLNMSDIRDLELPELPSRDTQQKVASILSAFDDLIENNSRRIEILEEMARRIYREWFVHFRYPGHEDDELVDSGTELGEIPEGWEVKKLLDVCNLQTGKALRSKQFNEDGKGVKAVRIRNVRTNSSETYTDEEFNNKYLVENGDILVGMDGDFHMCRWADGQSVLVQRVARFRPKKEAGLSKYFFFWAIKKPIDYFNRTITGTTVAHLGKKHIKTIEILLPPENLRKRINEILDPMYKQDIALRKQNKKLKETRDLLLPKLISGKINEEEIKLTEDALG